MTGLPPPPPPGSQTGDFQNQPKKALTPSPILHPLVTPYPGSMKTNPELPGPVGRAELKAGEPAVTGQAQRRSAKAALYVILPLVFFMSLIRSFPVHSACIGKLRSTQPKSIDERVEHILRHTPLIGNSPQCPS